MGQALVVVVLTASFFGLFLWLYLYWVSGRDKDDERVAALFDEPDVSDLLPPAPPAPLPAPPWVTIDMWEAPPSRSHEEWARVRRAAYGMLEVVTDYHVLGHDAINEAAKARRERARQAARQVAERLLTSARRWELEQQLGAAGVQSFLDEACRIADEAADRPLPSDPLVGHIVYDILSLVKIDDPPWPTPRFTC